MISSINTNSLSQLYRSQGQEYSTLVSKIASGKEINKASDDYIGFTRAKNLQSDIKGFEDISTNLVELKGASQMASDVGNNLLEDLGRMKELNTLHGAAGATAEEQAVYQAEYESIASGITSTIANTEYDGNAVITDTSITSTAIDLEATPNEITLDFANAKDASGTSATATALAAAADYATTAIGAAGAAGAIDDAIEATTAFTVTAEGYSTQIDRQIEINENLVSNKEDVHSSLVDLDEVKALQEATQLQVRQQATVSMIAQANMMAGGVARLYS